MRLKLIPKWKTFLMRAWSVRLVVILALIKPISVYWFAMSEVVPWQWFLPIGVLLGFVPVIAQIIEQPKMRQKIAEEQADDDDDGFTA